MESKEKTSAYSPGKLFLLCLGLLCLNCLGIFKLWQHLGTRFETIHLALILLFIIEYIIFSSGALCLAAFFKGGFFKLKKFGEDGLIFGLVFGLIGGLSTGLGVGLISWLLSRLIYGLIAGLIGGLIVGLISWLAVGLLYGLLSELIALPSSLIPHRRL